MSAAKVAFEMKTIKVALDLILPVRRIKNPHKTVSRYRRILTSIKEVGLIEPLVIYPQKDAPSTYALLDGHLRHSALKELGMKEADCIIATDDESFTYNARVSRLQPIQEHKMIVKAVQNGVRPERIAAALDISLSAVRASMNLLEGVHPEAADMLKDKPICAKALRFLKKVSDVRQIEMAELMMNANIFASGYAEALYLGTPRDQLANPETPKVKEGMSREEIARMEQEMESLEKDFKAIDEAYGENMLNLTVVKGYTKKLLENAKVTRFLKTNYPEFLSEFEWIATAETL
jgi:hypothetical protein